MRGHTRAAGNVAKRLESISQQWDKLYQLRKTLEHSYDSNRMRELLGRHCDRSQ